MSYINNHEENLKHVHLATNLSKCNASSIFVSDICWPGTLEACIVRAPVPRCRIIALDTTCAKNMPGVRAIVTAKDITGKNKVGKTIEDQYFLCDEETYGVYDAIALVAADTLTDARNAAQKIELKYEELPGVYDLDEAMRPMAKLARPDMKPDSNLLVEYQFQSGDPETAINESAIQIAESFVVNPIEHCYMENDCAIARFLEDGSLEVYVGCHDIVSERDILADVLEMPKSKIQVIQPYMGGSFGGKDDGLICAYVALLARATGSPVRIWIDRDEEMYFHTKRHGQRISVKMGFDNAGNITGSRYDIVTDTGSSAHHGENIFKFVSSCACGPYVIDDVGVNTRVYYTNNMAMGAMRSWGITGITFANETMLNLAARKLGIHPLRIRALNAICDGDRTLSGSIIPENPRYLECLNILRRLPLKAEVTDDSRYAYGVGYAGAAQGCNLHFGHEDISTVNLRVGKNGHIYIEVSANDLGQGLETTLVLITSRMLLGYPVEFINYSRPNSGYPYGGPTGASRQTTLTGNATCHACRNLLKTVKLKGGAEALENLHQWLVKYGEGIEVTGEFSADITSDLDKSGKGFPVNQFSYGAQRVEVTVDKDTGLVKVLHIDAVCDCGTVLNLIGAEGQVQGAISQSLGMALMEKFCQDNGVPKQRGFSEYLFPTSVDVPPIDVSFIDFPVQVGELQIKGMAELFSTLTSPAVVDAIYDAIGVWITELPATPERVLMALAARKGSINVSNFGRA